MTQSVVTKPTNPVQLIGTTDSNGNDAGKAAIASGHV